MRYRLLTVFFLWMASLSFASETLSNKFCQLCPPAMAEGWNFSFSAPPYISAKWVHALTIKSLFNSSAYEDVVAINLEAHHLVEDSNVNYYRTREPDDDSQDRGGIFSYHFIGKTESGIYVLKTSECYGGTGHFEYYLFLTFEKEKTLDGERVVMKRLGERGIGDRWYGSAKVVGNEVLVSAGEYFCGGIKTDPYVIDLSKLKVSSLPEPDQLDVTSWKALHAAIKYECYEDLPLLLKLGAPIDQLDEEGRTPLIAAAEKDEKVALFFLNQGADPHVFDTRNRSVLDRAILHKYDDLFVALLDKGAAFNEPGCNGDFPMDKALSWGSPVQVRELFKRGARPSLETYFLRRAISKEIDEVVSYLLDNGVQPNIDTLAEAIEMGNLEMLKLLHQKGGDIEAIYPNYFSLVHLAVRHENLAILSWLLSQGVYPNCVWVHENQMERPLDLALEKQWREGIQVLKQAGAKTYAESLTE